MIVEGYGIVLRRLAPADIELVRFWRNSERIQKYMLFREEISEVQQKEWFTSINTIHNNYFIIEFEGKKIGLINGAQIDWEKMETKSGGIFIWDETYWQTTVPIAAALLLTDTSVLLGLKRTYATILRNNKNAISFNEMFGYQRMSEGNEEASMYVLEKERYILRRTELRKSLFKQFSPFKLRIVIPDLENPLNRFYFEKLRNLPKSLSRELELIVNA